MDYAEQVRAANLFIRRLFLQNPLLHTNIWPIDFTAARSSGAVWQELTFGTLDANDVFGFPKLDRELINPIALELISGPHALQRADSVLTCMKQLEIKARHLTRGETVAEMHNFPDGWKLCFTEITTPQNFQPSPEFSYCSHCIWN